MLLEVLLRAKVVLTIQATDVSLCDDAKCPYVNWGLPWSRELRYQRKYIYPGNGD